MALEPNPTSKRPPAPGSIFAINDEITVSRSGCKIIIRSRDGSTRDSDSVESNMLYEVWKALKRK